MMKVSNDCIFVFAGRPERKVYGLQLFQSGIAEKIIFSVARYEWRHFLKLGLGNLNEFEKVVRDTEPEKRYFFIEFSKNNKYSIYTIKRYRYGTLSEAMALAQIIEKAYINNLIIVSSRYHMRRAVYSINKFLPDSKVNILPQAVPLMTQDDDSNIPREKNKLSNSISEYLKFYYYKFVLLRYYR
jgi:hypothetical protein